MIENFASTDDQAPAGLELLAFRVGDQEFCIEVLAVRELRGWSPATPLPRAPPYMRGVINLRGTVLPIVDLAVRLGLPSGEPSARHVIIVAAVGDQTVGLLVDGHCEIVVAPDGAMQPAPDIRSDTVETFVSALITIEDRMIGLLILDQLLPPQEAQAA
ncbi:MAG TPA: chemotaxis protein CheW [Caulobacteraceae bacterium]|jgi:purine-binding chemotaxis protein CheW|nr:chemotaxis protein CheW [Caulobacteraceae bacterium]